MGKNMLRCTLIGLGLALAGVAGAQQQPVGVDSTRSLPGETLVNALRAGGLTLVFRHAASDPAQRDTLPVQAADCARQRNLTEAGRAQARAIGEGLAVLRVPIGEVIASPLCRAMETARLIAGQAKAENAVLGFDPAVAGAKANPELLRAIVKAAPPAGVNRLVVGHDSSYEALTGSRWIEQGEGAVLRVVDGKFVVLARLRPGDWKQLAATNQRSAAPDPGFALEGAALAKALSEGGLTVYFRHALTDRTQADRPNFVASDCAMQRNLSEAGRAQARRIGDAIERLRLPVGDVIASPYCRTMQTARLISRKTVRAEEAVRGRAVPGNPPDFSGLDELLARPAAKGEGLRIVVGHGNGFEAVAGVPHLEEGDAAVLRPGPAGWVIVARLRAEEWERLPDPATSAREAARPDPPGEPLRGKALVDALRGGGYTLLFRHATRDLTRTEDATKLVLADCETQVPLSAEGRGQVRSMGEAFRKLGIPIGESIASPFCRTMDTARGIAGRATAEEAVRGENAKGFTGTSFEGLARIVGTPPAPGTNRLIAGHVSGYEGLGGTPYLQEGEAVVYRATGNGRRVQVARVRAEDWQALAAANDAARPPSSAPDPLLKLSGQPLLNVLRAGGYAIYFRHAATDMAQQDRPAFDAADCAAQRNLSAAGREQAARIGAAIQVLRLPITEILASPYCRTMETARLVAGTPTATEAIRGKASTTPGAPDYSALARLLATPAPPTGLRVIVGHGNGFRAAAGEPHLQEGEAAVLRAVEGGGWVVIARLLPADWDALADVVRSPR